MPKVILISGGSDGVGKAIAKKLTTGNQVVILAHNPTKPETAAKEIGCDFVEAELTDFDSLRSAISKVAEKYHQIDVLVNNAGVWMEGELSESSPEKIKEVLDINTTGTIFLTKAVLPGMLSQGSGQIINIISQDGLIAKKNRSIYHASKWAITGFTKCLQEDLSAENIKVTGIYPGLIKTNLFAKSGVARDLTDALDPIEIANTVEYVINLSPGTFFPEIGIINKQTKSNKMDDTNTPVIDLNIDPNMIAAQDASPQVKPAQAIPDPASPHTDPGIIDITPGSSATFPPIPSPTKDIDITPLPEPNLPQITPSAPVLEQPHLSDIAPKSIAEPIAPVSPEPVTETLPDQTGTTPPPFSPPSFSPMMPPVVTPSSFPGQDTNNQNPMPAASPHAEDPDLVKLVK